MHLRHLLVEEGSAASALALASWCPSFSSVRSPPSRFPHHLWRLYSADFERSCPNLICIHLYISQTIPGSRTPVRDQHNVNQLWHPRLLRLHLCLSRLLPRLLCIRTFPHLPPSQSLSPRVATLFGSTIILHGGINFFSLSLLPCKSQRNFCHFQSLMNI